MRMSEKCRNHSSSDNSLTSRHTDGGKNQVSDHSFSHSRQEDLDIWSRWAEHDTPPPDCHARWPKWGPLHTRGLGGEQARLPPNDLLQGRWNSLIPGPGRPLPLQTVLPNLLRCLLCLRPEQWPHGHVHHRAPGVRHERVAQPCGSSVLSIQRITLRLQVIL